MSRASFSFSIEDIGGFLKGLLVRTPTQILEAGAVMADKMEAQAKRDAPWTDRTGEARRTLEGINRFADSSNEIYCIGICGNQPYSPELERGFNRRYAVLLPTLRIYEPDLLESIRDIIGRQEGIS